jgi:hypothetical protein
VIHPEFADGELRRAGRAADRLAARSETVLITDEEAAR